MPDFDEIISPAFAGDIIIEMAAIKIKTALYVTL